MTFIAKSNFGITIFMLEEPALYISQRLLDHEDLSNG